MQSKISFEDQISFISRDSIKPDYEPELAGMKHAVHIPNYGLQQLGELLIPKEKVKAQFLQVL